jgi:pyruvate/2-oxoglutarate dehydrogenase complex dihydrolipoamide acyltransferase (E2) component
VEVSVPDLGDFADVEIIEVFVKPGDRVEAEDPIVTLETDKATLDVPSPAPGIVRGVKIAVGDRVSTGDALITLETQGEDAEAAPSPARSGASAEPASAAAGPRESQAAAAGAKESGATAAGASESGAAAAGARQSQPRTAAEGNASPSGGVDRPVTVP